jgi:hypothetical protein
MQKPDKKKKEGKLSEEEKPEDIVFQNRCAFADATFLERCTGSWLAPFFARAKKGQISFE